MSFGNGTQKRKITGAIPLAVALATGTGQSQAETSGHPDVIEEIVVTAQRRVENLQDVAISAQVVSGESLQEHNLNSLEDLSEIVPSLHITPSGRSSDLYIRGIGSGNNQSFDQSVGTFVDDVYHGRARVSSATFLDLERVEVLKGPQTTFFGNNAIAGALNLTTRKPTDSFDASMRALYGQFGQYAAEGAVGGALTDSVSVRVAAIADGSQGWLKNTVSGNHSPDINNTAARLSLLYKASDAFSALLKLEGSTERQSGALAQQVTGCPPQSPFVAGGFCNVVLQNHLPTGLDNNDNAFPPDQGYHLQTEEAVLTLNYKTGAGLTLTSVSAFTSYHFKQSLDGDATPLALLTAYTPERYHQFSQELRVASPLGQTLEYLAGVYYQTDHLYADQDFGFFFLSTPLATSPLRPYLPLGQNISFDQPERTYSAFASATWNATERLKISAALRGSDVQKDVGWNLYYGTASQRYGGITPPLPTGLQGVPAGLGLGTPGTLHESRSDHAYMPSAKVQYRLANAAMVYASYTRGFKAGGFNGTDAHAVAADLPYNPEFVNAYEVGLKSTWFEDHLLLNLATFRSNYSDLQVTVNNYLQNGAPISVVQNAATSVSQGVEFESEWRPASAWRVVGNVTYLDAHYVDYQGAGATSLQQLHNIPFQDLSGAPTPLAPRWSGSTTVAYTQHVSAGLQLVPEVSLYASSRYFLSGVGTNDDLLSQSGYTRVDGRITLETVDGRWSLGVIGKNLTDRTIAVFGSTLPSALGTAIIHKESPRSVAVQATYHW